MNAILLKPFILPPSDDDGQLGDEARSGLTPSYSPKEKVKG